MEVETTDPGLESAIRTMPCRQLVEFLTVLRVRRWMGGNAGNSSRAEAY